MFRLPPVFLMAIGCHAVLTSAALESSEPTTPAKLEFFEAKIRPMLVDHCYKCHNSTKDAQGGLAVDCRAALLKGGDGGVIVIPGNPAKSRLLSILRHEVDGLEMPKQGPKLDKSTVGDFEKWIADGAVDPRHQPPSAAELSKATSWESILRKRKQWWSFQPISKRPPPTVADNSWSEHPIDLFVLSKLRQNSLTPNCPADARTLVRRLHYALTGLPPTVAEIERFVRDLSAQSAPPPVQSAISSLIDRLLASPQFGERWARHWMDWVRYAESHGSEGDPEIVNAWQYRDYLIRAFNADVPVDQLIREHVAGDLLDKPRVNVALGINESVIGPAHWRMVFHGFGPTDPLEEKSRFIDDQINAFSKAFLGLTVSCAKCHDHKFDAIGQRDYYALFGILNSCRPSRFAIDLPEILGRHRERLARMKPMIRSAVAEAWIASASNLRSRLLASDGPWKKADKPTALLHPFFVAFRDSAKPEPLVDRWRRLVDQWNDSKRTRDRQATKKYPMRWNLTDPEEFARWTRYGVGMNVKPARPGNFAIATTGDTIIAGIYPSGVFSHGVSTKHAARLTSRDFHLNANYELWLRVIGDGGAVARYVVRDYPRDGTIYPIARLAPQWRWQKFDMTYWNGDDIHLEIATGQDAPLMVSNEARSWFGIREAILMKKGDEPPIECNEGLDPIFALAAASPPTTREQLADFYVRAIVDAARAWKTESCTDAQASLLSSCVELGLLPNRLAELPKSRALIAEYRRLEAEIAVPTRVPGLEETSGRRQFVYERGNHKRLGVETPPRFLEAIDPTPYGKENGGRLRLAEDLLRADNSLTRRVIVNRIWHHLFGRGIVPTPDNFGRLGLEPTHPELLDYLASRFSERGWSIKDLIRFIVTSKTWQLDSRPANQAARIDPDNLLLSHASLRRLEAEAIRDSLLAVSGALNRERFGPPVDGASTRRSIYVHVRRNSLDPFLRAFDFPEPFSATGRRDTTNVPAQSLTMLNDPWIATLADRWSASVLADLRYANDEVRIGRMIYSAFGRPASTEEVHRCKSHLTALATGEVKSIWSDFARSLFLCKEFVYLQ